MAFLNETKNTKFGRRKIFPQIVTGVCILFLTISAFLIVLSAVAKRTAGGAVVIFGYSFSIVQSDSMTGEIEVGELIAVKICDIQEAQVGTNAVFIGNNEPLKGRQIVHKVVKTDSDETGRYILTQGVKAGAPIDDPVYRDRFVGIAVRHSAFWGGVAKFFSLPANRIFLLVLTIGIPCVFASIRLVIKYSETVKKEKAQEAAAERKKQKEELLNEYSNHKNSND